LKLQAFGKRARDMAKSPTVVQGQGYREVGLRLWANLPPVWVVESVAMGADGIEYANLFCAGEVSLRKKLSTTVLKDKQRYGPATYSTPVDVPI
jgi:hypothetical protein